MPKREWKAIRLEPETYIRLKNFRVCSRVYIRSMSHALDILLDIMMNLKKEKKLHEYMDD